MIKPLADFVVLSFQKEETKTESGIILSTQENDKPAIGIVIAKGPQVETLQENDKVIYQSYSGTKIKLEGTEYLIIKSENILAKIE